MNLFFGRVKQNFALILVLGGLAIVLGVLESIRSISKFEETPVVPVGNSEGCLFCHGDTASPGTSHPVDILGCQCCHLGNGLSRDKERAHRGMVINGGDLRIVHRTCGRPDCHPQHVQRVKNSIMATNLGFISSVRALFGEREPISAIDVEYLLLHPEVKNSPALSMYSKLCGSCHLWKKKGEGEDEYSLKGGGCSACHYKKRAGDDHSELTVKIEDEVCNRCHNRSGRISLTYSGKFESDGYFTPFSAGHPASREMSGQREFINTTPDIHFEKGLKCIDCHTATGLMGDGKRYKKKGEQVDITCTDCHRSATKNGKKIKLDDATIHLSKQFWGHTDDQNHQSLELNREVFQTRKGTPLYSLFEDSSGEFPSGLKLRSKLHGTYYPSTRVPDDAAHSGPNHGRLQCQACHDHLAPQCFGCHIGYSAEKKQFDHLTQRLTDGFFDERRDFIRFESPALGITAENEVGIFVPGMHTSFKDVGDPSRDFCSTRYAPISPHSTRKESRSCADCHQTATILTSGRSLQQLAPSGDDLRRINLMKPTKFFPELDGWTSEEGFQSGTNRPFSTEESNLIILIGACIHCHSEYSDGIYRSFRDSLAALSNGNVPHCPLNKAVSGKILPQKKVVPR